MRFVRVPRQFRSALCWLSACLLLTSHFAQAQSPSTYGFGSISRTYNSIGNSTGAVPTLTGTPDEGFYNNIPIGFTFRYAGTNYTTVSASTNGWLTFASSIADAMPTNNLNTGVVRPILAPLWDNLHMNAGGVYYKTVGSAPDRIFTTEWNNARWDANAPAGIGTISFQVRLYEGSNRIEFSYRQASGTVSNSSGGASIGLAGTANGVFLSLNDTGTSPTASATTETNNLLTKPATGQTYSFTPSSTSPNSLTAYTFTAATGTYNSLQPNTPLSGGTDDDGYYNGLPIGFTFRLGGKSYTNAAASTNGWLLLGQNIPDAIGTLGYTNSLASSTGASSEGLYPVLAPLWDDLSMGSGAFYYFTSGTAPNRVFTVEWYNAKWDYQASNSAISFQVRLYEGSNRIEYAYRQEAGALSAPTASIGMATGPGANNILSLNGTSATPTASYTTETNSISTKPASNQVYSFTPTIARLVPTSGTFTSIVGGSGTVAATLSGTPDEGYYNSLPVGFDFGFAGNTYTTVSASTNGWLTFGQTITNATPTNRLDNSNTAPRPLVAPLWDDLDMTSGSVYYQVSGTAPNRVFTVEWNNARWSNSATAGSISFQTKLLEGTDVVQFVYRAEAGALGASRSASIGLSETTLIFLSLGDVSTAPATSTSTSTNNLTARPADGQTYSFYPLSQTLAASSGTYTNGIPLSGGSADDGYYNGLPIGFTFRYDNVDYTTVSASTNGWLTFGRDITNAAPNNALNNGGTRPLVAPLWDDLSLAQGSLYYQTTGTAPNRVFTVEWYKALWEKGAATPTISFEARLFESTNRVEFVYNQETGTINASQQSASIGLAGSANNVYLSLNNSGSAPTASNTTNTSSISGRPGTAQVYGFAPAGINPLPVILVDFAAVRRDGNGVLTWKTAQELRNDRFEIESSTNGSTFTRIGTVGGFGSSTQPHDYTWTDVNLARYTGSTVYYRLRQVDTDGKAEYSEVRALRLSGLDAPAAVAYPNPFADQLAVQVTLGAAGPVALTLHDVTGRLYTKLTRELPAGRHEVILPNLAQLPAGMYLLTVAQGNQQQVVRVTHK